MNIGEDENGVGDEHYTVTGPPHARFTPITIVCAKPEQGFNGMFVRPQMQETDEDLL